MKQQCHRLTQLSFNSHGKAVLLFQQYIYIYFIFFSPKDLCEIVTNLLEDLLHQGRVCIVNGKECVGEEAASS